MLSKMSYSTFYQNLSDVEYEQFMRVCYVIVYKHHVPHTHVITHSAVHFSPLLYFSHFNETFTVWTMHKAVTRILVRGGSRRRRRRVRGAEDAEKRDAESVEYVTVMTN